MRIATQRATCLPLWLGRVCVFGAYSGYGRVWLSPIKIRSWYLSEHAICCRGVVLEAYVC